MSARMQTRISPSPVDSGADPQGYAEIEKHAYRNEQVSPLLWCVDGHANVKSLMISTSTSLYTVDKTDLTWLEMCVECMRTRVFWFWTRGSVCSAGLTVSLFGAP